MPAFRRPRLRPLGGMTVRWMVIVFNLSLRFAIGASSNGFRAGAARYWLHKRRVTRIRCVSDSLDEDITRVLCGANLSPAERSERLLALVYEQLREMARRQMARERSDHTLEATALVHEAYLRLVGQHSVSWESRRQFFFAASRAMQQILIEHARARGRAKRGGGAAGTRARHVPINIFERAQESDAAEILALNDAFCRLEVEEPEAAAVVRMRFFAGLSGDETAAVLAISPRQVDRLWAFARAWLFRALDTGGRSR